MSDRQPQIPAVQGIDQQVARVLSPLKQVVEQLTGRTGVGVPDPLGPTAGNNDLVNKINEIIKHLSQ